MAVQRRARNAARVQKKDAKLKSDQEAAAARLLVTCRICDISRHPGRGGLEGVSLWQVEGVPEVQGYDCGRLFHCEAHGDLH